MMRERIETFTNSALGVIRADLKRFTLLPHHFSMENGELTNTLKLRRSVVNHRYYDVIEKMYEE